jgi:cytochrome c peroxidase
MVRTKHWRWRVGGAAVVALGGLVLLTAGASAGGAGAYGRKTAEVELGRRLFFDPEASRSGRRSCASCHDPEHAFSDAKRASEDDFGRTLRHSQTLVDFADSPTAHWDGEFDDVEELVVARLGVPSGRKPGGYGQPPPPSRDPPPSDEEEPVDAPGEGGGAGGPPVTPSERADEASSESSSGARGDDEAKEPSPRREARRRDEAKVHGVPIPDKFDVRRLVAAERRLEGSGRYAKAFEAAYGSSSVTTARLAAAISEYVRTIRSTDAAFDRYLAGDEAALTPSARRGHALVRGRAGCAACHTLGAGRPALTDYEFHNTGVAWRRRPANVERGDLREEIPGLDDGRATFSTARSDRRAFKTPTLRDVARRGPWMHDGSFATLEEVVRHYVGGGVTTGASRRTDPFLDKRVRPFSATDEDVRDLVAFLEALSGEVRPGLAPEPWRARAEVTRLRFLDGERRPMPGLPVRVVPAGDTLPGDVPCASRPLELVTDERGWIEYAPPMRTHVRLVLAEGLEPVGGDLVPDTCDRAEVVLPVRGRTALVVTFAAGMEAPDRIVVEHATEMELPKPMVPRSVLVRESDVTVGGRSVARYAGWLRTDLSRDVRVLLPGDRSSDRMRRLTLGDKEPARLELGP